ncbi:uncharacterized protein F4812DRAFT_429103 [Daldinia caldariorum]|uniref:uncharacterized protein n=1 Tax=Daldinia caldariorum TaxID=326644 RepID=UPI002008A85C|nr:uncharacterized protein F4812DRAFT_429103 [Daldinia caldariorum]KAI1468140.1 hypothetical protein F4812DRAFT_429103 [Daldinia caldariorum]
MRASSSIAAVAVLARGVFAQCTDSFALLAGNQEIAEQCAPKVSTDAVALCNSYLGTSTVFAVPPSKTAFTTTTKVATRTVTRVVFAPTTTTETEIIISTSSTTVFAAPSPGPIGRREIEANGSPASPPACPTLASLPTDSISGSAISSACSCLGASAVVSTASSDATTTSTITKLETTVTTATTTSAIFTYTKSTTTTVVAVETQTVAYDRCSVGYSSGGNGKGNHVENVQANSSQHCCQKCQQKQNCVASVHTGAVCQLLIKETRLQGASTSEQCPLGVEDYPFGPTGGVVYPGPCGY